MTITIKIVLTLRSTHRPKITGYIVFALDRHRATSLHMIEPYSLAYDFRVSVCVGH